MLFLPINKGEVNHTLDIIIITGDAYIDHPSFGPVLIARYLEKHGFTVGIIAQPDWKKDDDFLALGRPNLFFGISSGNLDSMVANYTADKKIRRTDMYTPEGVSGKRPDRATIIYTNKVKALFPGGKTVLGGVEGSLRRFAHYDYWDDSVRRPILFDTKADLLVYGMAEMGILEIAKRMKESQKKGIEPNFLDIPNGTMILKDISHLKNYILLPSFEEVKDNKEKYAEAFKLYYNEGRKKHPRTIVQPCQGRYLVVSPPHQMTTEELDSIFELDFMRSPHPIYGDTKIPAWDFVKFSTISHRGCFGGCSFCAISQHQGKYITSRSEESIAKEVKTKIIPQKEFKGTILDIGGPTANMYQMECIQEEGCTKSSCIYPTICPNLKLDHKPLLKMLKNVRNLAGVKHLFSNSGIRYDMAINDPEYLEELTNNLTSGQLSVAPEHICEDVLSLMGKPGIKAFENFKDKFNELSEKSGKKQFLIPYFISSHPGSTLDDALKLALYLKKEGLKVEQVQNFTPTPMTVSTCMYHTGLDPFTGKKIHVPRGEERSLQRALLQPTLKKNKRQVIKALTVLNRRDLIKLFLG